MPTIKDIAVLAGVSHGTVSNVLNGRGNVSVEKITLVENAARQLGYTMNAQASQLRKGKSRRVGVVIPQLHLQKYRDLYLGIEREMRNSEYEIELFCSNDVKHNEEQMLQKIECMNPIAIVAVTSFLNDINVLRGESHLILAERCTEVLPQGAVYCGFDYRLAGEEMARRCLEDGHKAVAVLTGDTKYSSYNQFLHGIKSVMEESGCIYKIFSADDSLRFHTTFDVVMDGEAFDAVITTHEENLEYLCAAAGYGELEQFPAVYAISSKNICSRSRLIEYQLNYRLFGKRIGEYIKRLEQEDKPSEDILKVSNDGFYHFPANPLPEGNELKILMLSGPTCRALSQLLPQFTKETGIRVKLMEAGYDELYRTVKMCVRSSPYDLIRMDMAWMSELGESLFSPLPVDEAWLTHLRENFSDSLSSDYFIVGDQCLSLPFDPSVQLLYYRKELFQDARIRREYYERYRKQLEVPKTFEEFDEIAEFFTRRFHKNSPVSYGTSLVFGSSVVAACDYLPRLKAKHVKIFDKNGKTDLTSEKLVGELEAYKRTFEYTDKETNSWWRKAMEKFSDGQVAMNIVFANYASLMVDHKKSDTIGKIGFAPVPGCCPMLGGGVLGISKDSSRREACREFMKWVYDEKTAAMITYLGGYINHRKLKENLDVVELYPWLEGVEEAFALGWRREAEHANPGFNEFIFEDILGNAVRSAVSGIMSPRDALNQAQMLCMQEFE